MQNKHPRAESRSLPWIPLSTSATLILRTKLLLGWSALLVLVTIVLTWIGFQLTTELFDHLPGAFFTAPPATDSILGWLKYSGWLVAKGLFLLVSRIVAFYLAFLAAYSLSAPLYVFLSTAAEKIHAGKQFQADEGFTLRGIIRDLLEGFKIGAFGIIVTIVALAVSFIPLIGQITVFLLYTYYSALMFIDYPSSRRHWSLGRKISWISNHSGQCFRLGVIPAVVSMIPILNIFLIALIFPLFTVHSTLNFYAIEQAHKIPARRKRN